jgi:hypothetical protein
MGKIAPVDQVKLITGIIASGNGVLKQAKETMAEKLGTIDSQSAVIPFDFTDYYLKEMGGNLLRQWVSFKNLINPDELAKIKVLTNEIESSFAESAQRKVNLDPGYLSMSKLVLASTKNYSHRIYLSDGIYAEITLQYMDKNFHALAWTYPDYASDPAAEYFTLVREKYSKEKNGRP